MLISNAGSETINKQKGKTMKRNEMECGRKMPELKHSFDGEKFDIEKSEVVNWLINQPDVKLLIYDLFRVNAYIVYDPEKKTWKGNSDVNFKPKRSKPERGSQAPDKNEDDVLSCVPATGRITKNALITQAQAAGIGFNRAWRYITLLTKQGRIALYRVPRSGTNARIEIERAVNF